jgi:hypothetical protein
MSSEYHCKYDELIDPAKLLDHPRNVNKHPRRQLDALSAVIWGQKRDDGTRDVTHALGWRHSVVVSKRSGYIVMGHARKTVALEAGELVPVCYQDFASEADERAMLRADNRISELAELDIELEQLELAELAELDIPILDFGFEISNPQVKEPKEVNVKPVDDDGYGHFEVTAEDHAIRKLIEVLTSIDGVCWERKK